MRATSLVGPGLVLIFGLLMLLFFPPVGLAVIVIAAGYLTLLLFPSPSRNIVGGIVWTLIGLFIYLWASRHSPYDPFGAIAAGGLDNYVLKEPFYTMILLVTAGLGLLGISLLVLGLIDRAKLP